MNPWLVLNLEETDDKDAIRRAYMVAIAKHNPEDDPEGFQRVRAAYEEILETIDAVADDTPMGLFKKKLELLYGDFSQRISVQSWKELLKEDVCVQLATEDAASNVILIFLLDHWYLPSAVLQILNDRFAWLQKKAALTMTIPAGFFEYMENQIVSEYPSYDQFPIDISPDRFIYLLYEADGLVGRNELDDVDLLIDEMEQTGINHPCLLHLKSKLALARGEKENALVYAREAFLQYSDDVNSRFAYAIALQGMENAQDALVVFKGLLDELPSHFGAVKGLIECLISLEEYEEARERLLVLFDKYPSSAFVLMSFQHVSEMLIERYEALHRNSPDDIEIAFTLAKHYLNRARYDDCYELLGKYDEAESQLRYYEFMGECLVHMGETERALEFLQKDVSLQKKSRNYVILVSAYNAMESYDDAIIYADEGLAIDDNDTASKANLHYSKGMALHKLEKQQEALVEFDVGLEVNDQVVILYTGKAYVYRDLGMYAEAIDCCALAIQILPYNPEPYVIIIEIYLSTGNYNNILNIIEDIATYGLSEHPWAQYYKATALAAIGSHEQSWTILLELISSEEAIEESYKPRVYREMAYVCEMREEFGLAIEYIQKAIAYDSKGSHLIWELHLGRLYRKHMEYSKAIKIFNRLIKEESFGTAPYIDRGETYLQIDQLRLAKKSFESAAKMDICQEGDYDWIISIYSNRNLHYDALNWAERLINSFDSAESRNIKGRVLINLNKGEDAIAHLEKSIDEFPTSERLRQRLAYCYIDIRDDYQSALDQYYAILDMEPRWPNIIESIGDCLSCLGKYDEAIDLLNENINQNPDNVSLFARRGYIYKNMNKQQEAVQDFLKALSDTNALRASWSVEGIYYSLGHTYRVFLNDDETALEYFNLALEWNSEYANALISIGYIHYWNDDYKEALEWFHRAISADAGDPDCFLARAETYKKLGEKKKAVKDFRKALKMYLKKTLDACTNAKIGSCYMGLGNNKKALAHFEEAINNAAKCTYCPPKVCHEAYFNLCLYHQELNQLETAKDHLETALNAANSTRYNIYKSKLG
ncbi:MAG: tetratricopeptide repeat protein [Oscillospiraceae bacterium]|nr:tetratricopeptide repeat protein [Oscillospiraceae bacterium]